MPAAPPLWAAGAPALTGALARVPALTPGAAGAPPAGLATAATPLSGARAAALLFGDDPAVGNAAEASEPVEPQATASKHSAST